MKIVCIGGGPAGLYLGILMKKADPANDVTIVERNRADDTFGFGVVFSDETVQNFADADPATYEAITRNFAHWNDIDIHYNGAVLTSTGHGFAGMSRKTHAQHPADARRRARRRAAVRDGGHRPRPLSQRRPDPRRRRRQFVDPRQVRRRSSGRRSTGAATSSSGWAPSSSFPPSPSSSSRTSTGCSASTPISTTRSTRPSSSSAPRRRGSAPASTRPTRTQTIAYCEALFRDELKGARLIKNRSLWRTFPTVKNKHWHHENIVLMGDAAHTAHFSIGSGTKLAMEDAIALSQALQKYRKVDDALDAYEAERRPGVDAVQRAAQVSLQWFEETERYFGRLEPVAVRLLDADALAAHHAREPAAARSRTSSSRSTRGSPTRRPTRPASTCRPSRRRRRCSRRSACATW